MSCNKRKLDGKSMEKEGRESLIETVDKDRSPDEAVVETRAMDNDNDKDKDLVINESA